MSYLGFLWVDGIHGDSRDPRHLREFDVVSYAFESASIASGHHERGSNIRKLDGDIGLILKIPMHTVPVFFDSVINGNQFKTAILQFERNIGGRSSGTLSRYVMRDISVSKMIPIEDTDHSRIWSLTLHYESLDTSLYS